MAIERRGKGIEELNEIGTQETEPFISGSNTRDAMRELLNEGIGDSGDKGEVNIEVLGLNSSNLLSLTGGNYTEYMNKFIETSVEVVKDGVQKVDIFKIDKEKFDLDFSSIVYATKVANRVYFFIALLEKTGRPPVELKTIIDELNNKFSDKLLVTADAITDELFNHIENVLTVKYGNVEKINVEGVVVPHNSEVEITSTIVARYAYDILYVNIAKDVGKARDLTLSALNQELKNGFLNIDLAFNNGVTINKLGKPIHTDFHIEGSIIKNNTTRGFGSANGKRDLSLVTGYLDFLIHDDINPYTNTLKKMGDPIVVINEFVAKAPTLNYVLMNIINTAVFANYANIRNLFIEKDVGPLNLIFNYGSDNNKAGEVISFKDSKADVAVINDILQTHFNPNPIYAVETELFGSDFAYTSAFATLADPAYGSYANADIIKAAEELIGENFDNINVALNEGLDVPVGEFIDADGNVRDIREIDAVYIAKYTNNPMLVIDWVYSNLPTSECRSVKNVDPYILKLQVLDAITTQLGIKVTITGKARRVILNPVFIQKLVEGASRNNYIPRIESPHTHFVDNNNLQSIAMTYANAAVGQLNFGVNNGNGFVINTPNLSINSYAKRYR